MRIAILVEGKTEMAFMPSLRSFLSSHLEQRMPRLDPKPYHGRIPKKDKLRRVVENHLTIDNYDAVIALTDVYTDSKKKDFEDAEDAKNQMRGWVGDNTRFHPHAAQYDFEAWLLPFWPTIQKLAKKHDKSAPGAQPEQVNHNKPPSKHIKEMFELGKCRDSYVKPRDARRILEGKNLRDAAVVCPELKAFLNTILMLCDGELIS